MATKPNAGTHIMKAGPKKELQAARDGAECKAHMWETRDLILVLNTPHTHTRMHAYMHSHNFLKGIKDIGGTQA